MYDKLRQFGVNKIGNRYEKYTAQEIDQLRRASALTCETIDAYVYRGRVRLAIPLTENGITFVEVFFYYCMREYISEPATRRK